VKRYFIIRLCAGGSFLVVPLQYFVALLEQDDTSHALFLPDLVFTFSEQL